MTPVSESLSLDALVGRVVDEFIDRLDQGERPDVEEYARRHPEASAVIREVLQALQLVARLGSAARGGLDRRAALPGPSG